MLTLMVSWAVKYRQLCGSYSRALLASRHHMASNQPITRDTLLARKIDEKNDCNRNLQWTDIYMSEEADRSSGQINFNMPKLR